MADRESFKVRRRKTRQKTDTRAKKKAQEKANLVDASSQTTTRTKRKNTRMKRTVIRLATVAVAVLLIVVIAVNWNNLSPTNIQDWVSDMFASQGDGYPVEMDGSSVAAMKEVSNSLAVLTDTSLVMMNRNGGENYRWSVNYSKPLFRTAGRYVLVAELGGTRYTVYSRSKQVLKVTADNLTDDVNKTEVLDDAIKNRIISADIRDDGMVALVTEASQSHTTEVRVYSLKGKKIFQLKNATLMAMDVALSPDRQTLAIAGVQTEDGLLQSVVRIYDFSNAELLHEHILDDTMLFSVSYFSSGNVFALGDTACVTINPDNGKAQELDFSDRELVSMEMDGSNGVLALQNVGQMDGGELVFLSPKGEVQATHAFTGEFRDMTMKRKEVYLLTADRLHTVTASGGISDGLEVPQDSRMIASLNSQVMVVGLTQLSAYVPE